MSTTLQSEHTLNSTYNMFYPRHHKWIFNLTWTWHLIIRFKTFFFDDDFWRLYLICIILKKSDYSFSDTILYNELYRDPGTGNIIADSVTTNRAQIQFLYLQYSQDIVNSQCSIDLCKRQKTCWKNVQRGRTVISFNSIMTYND